MHSGDFHAKPFDEGTLTKLSIFELYAREWLPVFLSRPNPIRKRIHIFDFFAGPGTDSKGVEGSPLRLLRKLLEYRGQPAWGRVQCHVHFFDADPEKTSELNRNVAKLASDLPEVTLDVRPLEFADAFQCCCPILNDHDAAKLVFIDQFGVSHVDDGVFRQLISAPTCDFLFFISSSTLNRFRNHPAIRLKITRPEDSYHVHRAALDYYRSLLPKRTDYYLAPFSIRKGSNTYGLIFGTAHPLGMDKFLNVVWQMDPINGEANFDINRENIQRDELLLPLPQFQPTKLTAFQQQLRAQILDGRLKDELDVVKVCFDHGVRRQEAKLVLDDLRKEHSIECGFRVPQLTTAGSSRPIRIRPR